MNTQNTNQQQQLYGEPLYIDGTAGKKQVTGEPQFVSGEERRAHKLTPLYADNDVTAHHQSSQLHGDQYYDRHHGEQHHDRLHGEQHHDRHHDRQHHDRLYNDQHHDRHHDRQHHDRLYDEQHHDRLYDEQNRDRLYDEQHRDRLYDEQHRDRLYDGQHQDRLRGEHHHDKLHGEHHHDKLHGEHAQKPPAEHVHLTIHTDDPSKINLEELIHITPDGQIKVIPEEEKRRTEHLLEPLPYEPYHSESKSLKSKKASRSLFDRDTESTTVVKVGEHETGTLGHVKDRKSDTHHGADVTKVKVEKSHSTGDEHVHVKGEHLKAKKAGKKKRLSDKVRHRGDTSESTTIVKVGDHGHHRGLEKQHSESKSIKPHEHEKDNHGHRHIVEQLRASLNENENPNMDIIGDLLLKAEGLLVKSAHQTNVDPEARKALDDISTMLITAKQLERHKGIAERLQRISDECQKSVNTVKSSDTPSSMKNASKEAVDFVKIWRPVFQLLIRSRDFRQLIVDSLRIVKRVVTRNEGIMDDLTHKFIEGESVRELKHTAKEHRETNVNVKMTDKEWEYIQEEIQGVLAVLARNPQYHDAINRLFTLLEMFSSNVKSTLPSSESNRFDLEMHARKAKMETEELVASFTGKETLKEFKFRLRRLIQANNKDPEIRRYFAELKAFILSSKSEEEVRSELYRQRVRDLINWGRALMEKSKERNELELLLETGNQLLENVKNDEYVKELRMRAGIVRSDLTYQDSEGRTKIDIDMLVKLQAALMPVLAETFQKIHIPRIEHSDPRLDFWVDNVVLCGYDIFPDNIKFHIERETELSIRDVESKGSYTRLVVHLDKLRTEIRNIEFYFKKKTMPSLSDSGLVTFRIPENGAHLGIYFTLEERPGETHPRLSEGYAEFTIHKMDIEFDKSTLKHDVLLPMMIGLAKPAIKSQIEKAVETNLSNALKQLGDRLTHALGEMNRPSFLSGRFGSVKETIKGSDPAQAFAKRRVKLE